MASTAKLVIRVTSARGSSTIQYTSKGKYISLGTAGYNRRNARQPILPTSGLNQFWSAVVEAVETDLTNNPTPP